MDKSIYDSLKKVDTNQNTFFFIWEQKHIEESMIKKNIYALPKTEWLEIGKIINPLQRSTVILSRFALYYLLKKLIPGFDITRIQRTALGKPFYSYQNPEKETIHFNISHTKEAFVIGINKNKPIGVDIEKIKPVVFEDFKIVFNELDFSRLKENNALEIFYEIWTAKESIAKKLGKGLTMDFKSLEIFSKYGTYEDKRYYYNSIYFSDSYKISYCI